MVVAAISFNVAAHPTSAWTSQQIVEVFSDDRLPRFLIRDRDDVYGAVLRRRVKNIGMVNVMAGKRIVPECVQFEANGKNIVREVQSLLDPNTSAKIKEELLKVKQSLGESGASQKAAATILKHFG